ncbi:type II toxin-antitoxin system RelE/ParE family toxin [Nocardia sp. NPDC051981]|uniref:type II toxin-antitoxin system RelE family toxin n=1 Tax=Nocardia sp. NPDC051981 TaxID=3155417 RepID=UPI003416278B
MPKKPGAEPNRFRPFTFRRKRDAGRIRFGQYRIVYSVDDEADVVTIFTVAERSDVYR